MATHLTPVSTLQKTEKQQKNMSTWLAENPEMLEAALELVESWDQGAFLFESPLFTPAGSSDSDEDDDISVSSNDTSHSSSGVDSPPRLPSLAVKPPKIEARGARRLKPSTLTSTHHRRREEIKSLQTTSMDLERQLKMLQNTATGDGRTHEDQSSVWRDIAQRQQQLRSLAEAKQLSLRRRLDAQRRIEHGLVRLLQRARAIENDPWVRSIRYPAAMAGKIKITDLDQLRRVDRASENIDGFFADPRFHDGTVQFAATQVLEDQPGQFVIETSEAWTVPFDVDRTMEALWKCCCCRIQEQWCSTDLTWDCKMRVDAMALVADFDAVAKVGSSKGYFDGRVVVKRFNGSDSTPPAIINDFFFAPNRKSPGSFAGVHSQENSCIRVLPAMPTNTRGGQKIWRGSHVQFSQRFTIAFAEGDSAGRHHAAHFTNTMVGNIRNCSELMHGNVESMLLTSR